MLHPLDLTVVDVAFGRRPADSVLLGGQLVNVITGEIYVADIATASGTVALVGDVQHLIGPDTVVIDAHGRFVVPGLIDGHQHVEDSRMSVSTFCDAVVPAGTTSIYTGFDHIAAVAGLPGVRAFLDEAEPLPLNVFWGSPFRLPYTDPESTIGFRYTEAQHAEAMSWPECIGVWELCPDFLEQGDATTIAGIRIAREHGLGVYGSVPWAGDRMDVVSAHTAAGLRVDHEAYTQEELLEKMRLGLSILIRDSPIEHFLPPLIGLLVDRPELASRVGFCTDQANATDVAANGHISRLVREAIAAGIPPITAIQMATINTASIYRIDHVVGSLSPGRLADALLVDDLEQLSIAAVVSKGLVVARDGQMLTASIAPPRPDLLVGAFPREPTTAAEFEIAAATADGDAQVLVMQLTDNAFHRTGREATLPVANGVVQPSASDDIAVIAYVERFGKLTTAPGLAFVSGFGLQSGAIASSCTPDDDNILCVGTNPADMALAVNTLIEIGGGDVAVDGGVVTALLPLPVGGIVSDLPAGKLAEAQAFLDQAVSDLGCPITPPFMFLGVLCITGVPDYGMSENGLIDARTHQVVDIVLSPVG
jgi:adenine deaminase